MYANNGHVIKLVVDLRQLAYKQFVLPILEYCAPIWDLYHQKYIRQIEMVQHRAARFVLGKL